jgi:hypothetical protein
MNDNHDATKILGHIIQSRPLDKSGEEIELGEDGKIPVEFDLEVAGVLYRAFPALCDRVDEIIAKAKIGEIFVSMEAWFPDFGYGLIDPSTGDTKLIERTEATAFLTKHLRIYGGSGNYQGHKLGRVLKDIIFGAQGFVDDPANPESVIKVAANKVAAPQVFVNAELNELLEGGVVDVDEKQIVELQKSLKETQASLEVKEQEITKLQEAVKEFEAKNYKEQITSLTEKVNGLTDASEKLGEATSTIETITAEKDELQKELNEVKSRVEKSEAELDQIRKTESARERLVKLSQVKKIEDEKATLAELINMTEETFELVLKYASSDNDNTKDQKIEQAEAALDNVEVKSDDAEFNVQGDSKDSETEQWSSMAKNLCRKEEEKE